MSCPNKQGYFEPFTCLDLVSERERAKQTEGQRERDSEREREREKQRDTDRQRGWNQGNGRPNRQCNHNKRFASR